jgi:hypothetical protein
VNILQPAKSFPVTITKAAFHVATLANIAVLFSIVGQLAQVVVAHNDLLNAIFGQQKGTLIAGIALGLSQAATTFTAHGEPLGGSSVTQPSITMNAVATSPESQVTLPPAQ